MPILMAPANRVHSKWTYLCRFTTQNMVGLVCESMTFLVTVLARFREDALACRFSVCLGLCDSSMTVCLPVI